MIFDIITLPNSNQAVIVDKTQIPNDHEGYWVYFNDDGTLDGDPCPCNQPPGWFAKLHDIKNYAVVLASREPIPGVYLLPEWVWGRKEFIVSQYLKAQGSHDRPDITEHDFRSGYEAAGGYTREQMIELLDWYAALKPSEKVSVWSKDGQYNKGLFNMDSEQLVDRFMEKHMKRHPRQLDITLNEDGSLPVDEKGVVKVNNVIY